MRRSLKRIASLSGGQKYHEIQFIQSNIVFEYESFSFFLKYFDIDFLSCSTLLLVWLLWSPLPFGMQVLPFRNILASIQNYRIDGV